MTEPRTGIVGIGNMGLAMALNLLERGLPVGVRDLRDAPERVAADAGARVFASPAQMAAEVDLLILVVVDADQVTRRPSDGVPSHADFALAVYRRGHPARRRWWRRPT